MILGGENMAKISLKYFFQKEPAGEGMVANRNIIHYATGLAGQNIHYSYISGWLRYFCINVLHIDEKKVGNIFTLSYFWDAINDPVVGAYIDRRKHKPYNKLRPFLLYFPPLIGALGMLMFLNVPFNENGKLAYILVLYFVWDFFYSFQDVGLWGMIALSSTKSEERARVAQWVSIGAGTGSTIAGAFQFLRGMLKLEDTTVFILFGVLFALGGQLISMYAHKMPEMTESPEAEKGSVLKSITILRHNPTLLLISLARFSQGLSPKVQNAYFFENALTFVNRDTGKMLETVFGILAGVPGAVAMPFANKIATKIGGMKKLLVISQVAAIVLRVAVYFVGYDSWPRFITMSLLISLVNLPGTLMDIAHRSLTSDSIDEVELKTGVRTEGISFSMQNFTSKMTSAATTFIESRMLSLLDFDRFASSEGRKQGAKFIKWQWPMFMLGPVVGAVLYLIIISFIKDDKAHKAEVERLLRERKEALAQKTPAENAISSENT